MTTKQKGRTLIYIERIKAALLPDSLLRAMLKERLNYNALFGLLLTQWLMGWMLVGGFPWHNMPDFARKTSYFILVPLNLWVFTQILSYRISRSPTIQEAQRVARLLSDDASRCKLYAPLGLIESLVWHGQELELACSTLDSLNNILVERQKSNRETRAEVLGDTSSSLGKEIEKAEERVRERKTEFWGYIRHVYEEAIPGLFLHPDWFPARPETLEEALALKDWIQNKKKAVGRSA